MDPQLSQFIKKGVNDLARGFEDDRVVMQFIPIILILLFSLYSRWFVEVSHSVLGKLFAVVVIIFYTKLNILYGVFMCIITILFYQLTENTATIIEGMKKSKKKGSSAATPSKAPAPVQVPVQVPVPVPVPVVNRSQTATAKTITPSKSVSEDDDTNDEDVEDGTNLPDDNDAGDNDAGDNDAGDNDADIDIEGFEPYKSLYPVINIEDFNAAKEEFIKEKCKNGIVMYKDMPVKPEMVDHVFSEVHFTTKNKCNPCDRTCAYSIVENKLATEEELGRPKNSNDIFEWIKQLM